jgi:hypothetical protein
MKLMAWLTSLVLLGSLGSGLAWGGECTQEELLHKARLVQQKFQELERNNYDEYMRLLLRYNNKARQLNENDSDAWCDLYDQILFEI